MDEHRGLWRGKRTDNGEWVEGFYSCVTDNYTPKNVYSITTFETLKNGEIILTGMYAVDPSTLGECAGFTDKNGKLAFEGDLVKDDSNDAIGVIRYGEYRQPFNDDKFTKHIGFYIDWLEENNKATLRVDLGYWLPLVKIIGNIHDN